MKRSLVPLLVALVAGALLSLSSAAFAEGVTHRVSVGSADSLPPPGFDANFSLSAIQRADGTVTGEWEDTFQGRPAPAFVVHVDINCLEVVGNDAWVSGPLKVLPPDLAFLIGLTAITRVRDNGTSANDPADQVSFTFLASDVGVDDCHDMPDLPLFDLINGEVKVQ